MLIILEGPDGSGKTTLARELDARLGLHATVDVRHATPPTRHPLDEYVLPLLGYRPGRTHVICDRWHLGEAVYPRILERGTRWDVAVERYLHLFMQSRGASVILLLPDLDELQTRLSVRGDDLVTLDQLSAVVNGYDALSLRYFTRRYDYRAHVPATPSGIIKLARHLHLRAFLLNDFVTYVGPTRPHVLLFGDVRAPGPRLTDERMPAFMPYPATSGHYLLSHLDVVRLGVGIANACDVDDPVALYKTLHEPRVVALGRRAARRLDELGVAHGVAPHPQYVRRFHHGDGPRYAQTIEQAAYTREDLSRWSR